MARRENRTKRYPRPERDNAGVILPQFALHAALVPMVDQLAKGRYGQGSSEEPLIKVVGGMSQRLIEKCFAALQRRPPTVALQFPIEVSVLPWITIATDAMTEEGPVLDDYAGHVDEELLTVETPTTLTPTGGAVGGETVFFLNQHDIVSQMVDMKIVSALGQESTLDPNYDFTVGSDAGEITLVDPLVAGDVLICNRFAYYGLPGGDLFGTTFRFEHTILIDTNNPVLTNFLQALVWRELMLRDSELLRAGLVDSSFGVRSNSLWQQFAPALGHRIELTVSGLTTWQIYSRTVDIRAAHVNIDTISGTEDMVELLFDVPLWGDEEDSVLDDA